MKVGTRSLLYGGHQFILHPLMVAIGWRRHYGFWPKGWRTWVAIIVHDWGYWGLGNMDGDESKRHPLWAARTVSRWFGAAMEEARWKSLMPDDTLPYGSPWPGSWQDQSKTTGGMKIMVRPAPESQASYGRFGGFWFWFLACHSRHAADILGMEPSPLMIPDKLATALMPRPLYALLVWLTGEYREYVQLAHAAGYPEVPSDAWGYSNWLLNHWRQQFLEDA